MIKVIWDFTRSVIHNFIHPILPFPTTQAGEKDP